MRRVLRLLARRLELFLHRVAPLNVALDRMSHRIEGAAQRGELLDAFQGANARRIVASGEPSRAFVEPMNGH